MAAEHREAGDDVIARLAGAHFAADLLDDAGALMAEHDRDLRRIRAFDEVEIRVAHTGGDGADQHLVGAGFVDLNVFDGERLANFAQDGGFHDAFSLR